MFKVADGERAELRVIVQSTYHDIVVPREKGVKSYKLRWRSSQEIREYSTIDYCVHLIASPPKSWEVVIWKVLVSVTPIPESQVFSLRLAFIFFGVDILEDPVAGNAVH